MIEYINYYLIVGTVWLLFHELYLNGKMTVGMRFRLWAFWPVTVLAWIIGFLEAMRNQLFDDDDEY